MNFTEFVLPILLPVLFWMAYHYAKDHHLPEPVHHLLITFVFGVGAWYLGLAGYAGLGVLGLRFDAFELAETNPWGLLAYAVFAIGLIEELAKFLPFILLVVHFKEFDEPIDGIIYASFIALGFAAVENIQYQKHLTGWQSLARGFAGPVVHMVFASIWGYYVGRAWLCGRGLLRATLGALGFAVLAHGVYDFIVIAYGGMVLVLSAVIIAALWGWRLLLIRDLHTRPPGRCPEDPS